jgi:alkylation response protein AidB-like acyl-CoA dehydrogenase
MILIDILMKFIELLTFVLDVDGVAEPEAGSDGIRRIEGIRRFADSWEFCGVEKCWMTTDGCCRMLVVVARVESAEKVERESFWNEDPA